MTETDFEDEVADSNAASSEEAYASLDQALEAHLIPLENRELIRRAVAAVGIKKYTGTSSYIKAHRQDDGPILRICYGYTNGFVSRAEAESFEDHVSAWPSSRKGL